MPYSYAVYTGNGSTTQYAITFPYIRKEHVKVYVNYVDTAYTYANNTTVQLATAPANGLRVEVRRVTPASSVLVDYTDGSTLVAADLDTSNLQHLYLEQELDDALKQSIAIDSATGLPTAGGQRIINVGNPVNAQDAATKNYVDLAALGAISGNVTIDSGTLFVDATTNQVGIGTTSPSAPLTVSGVNADGISLVAYNGVAASPTIIANGASASTLKIKGGASFSASFNGGQIDLVGGTAAVDAGAIKFRTGTSAGEQSERVRIDGSGRLLVGTNISSQYTATTSSIQLTSTDSAQDPRIQLKANATTDVAAIDFGGGAQRHGTVQGESGGLAFYTNNSAGTGGVSSRMTIDSAGNITIAGVGAKIKADFTNGTVASRAYFQTSTTNGATAVGALPNGTSTTAGFLAHNNSTPTDSAYVGIVIDNVGAYLRSTSVGFATDLPLHIQTFGTTAITVDLNQNVLIGVASADANGGILQLSSGITFPAARVLASDPNTLDDYEEGTWTPMIAGVATAGTGTYTTQVGRYTRIGNIITLHFYLVWTAHTGTGNMILANLPVACANVANLRIAVACYANNLTITGQLFADILANSTTVNFYAVNNGTATVYTPVDTAATIAGTITYQV